MERGVPMPAFRATAHSKAKAIFVAGPARATQIISCLGFLRLWKFTGTGLAQPNIIGDLVMIKSKGRTIVPIRSIWGMGFRVNLPERRAVGSPHLSATQP